MKKIMLCAMLLLLLPLCGCTRLGPDRLTVTVLSIGKADCILLEQNGHAALIDAGEKDDAVEILNLLSDHGISQLDFMLLTHLDKDHIGSADTVLRTLPIGTLYAPDYDKGNKQHKEYLTALEELNLKPIVPRDPVALTLGGAKILLLPAAKETYTLSNDYSILAEVSFGEKRLLFAGDAEEERIGEYLASDHGAFDVLKVPHHGVYEEALPQLAAAVSPQYAIITDSLKNPADPDTLGIFQTQGAEVFCTKDGDIHIECDGRTIHLRQS